MKISTPTWNEEFQLFDGWYSVLDIHEYFEYIFKKHGEKTDNPSIRIYINKIENRITFKIKRGFYLELVTKLLGNTESKITKNKNGENVPHLEIIEVVLVHCNIVNNDHCAKNHISQVQEYHEKFKNTKKISTFHQLFRSKKDCISYL